MVVRLTRLMRRMTTMSNSSPWADIEMPGQDYNVRKIRETKGIPLYWGRDSVGHCLFIIELSGDQSELFRSQHVKVQGIKSELRFIDTSKTLGMVVSLEKHVDQDLFFAMCQTLITVLREVTDSATGLSVALVQIKRWKAFMAGRKRGLLSAEEVRGLFGELTFLQQMLDQCSTEADALTSWEGPESIQQDFILGNMAVEVKTLSGRERNSIRISSEDQLESLNDKLFLKVFRISVMPDSDRAMSLNGLVRLIADRLSDHTTLEMFYDKLAKAGYVELTEYDNPRFIVSEERLYGVGDSFPKLIRSELPEGVSNVHYGIDLERIKTFLVRNNVLWEK